MEIRKLIRIFCENCGKNTAHYKNSGGTLECSECEDEYEEREQKQHLNKPAKNFAKKSGRRPTTVPKT